MFIIYFTFIIFLFLIELLYTSNDLNITPLPFEYNRYFLSFDISKIELCPLDVFGLGINIFSIQIISYT